MSPRSIRRAAERKAARLTKQNPKQGDGQPALTEPQPPKRYATGPRTLAGKAISCLNNTKHGLTGLFRVLESESQELFDELRDTLRTEHAPATPTETILVDRMAEHVWLSQRAQRLQDDELISGNQKTFALFLRYQITNDRAFYRCLRELANLRRECRQFESQNVPQSANEFESQNTLQSERPIAPSAREFESLHPQTREVPKTTAADSAGHFESQKPVLELRRCGGDRS